MYCDHRLVRLFCSVANCATLIDRQLNVGSRCTQYRLICSPNSVGAPVVAGVTPKTLPTPRSQPTHNLVPSALLGPSQMLFTVAASNGVRHSVGSVDAPGWPQIADLALYAQTRSSWMIPSVMPSSGSQAARALWLTS